MAASVSRPKHGRLISVKQMDVGTANRAGGDLDRRISRALNLWSGRRIDTNVAFSVPA